MPGKRRTASPHKSGPHAKKGQHVLQKLLDSNGVLARAAALADAGEANSLAASSAPPGKGSAPLPDSAEPVAAGNAAVEAACGQDGAPVPGSPVPLDAAMELPDFDTLWESNDAESISMLSLDLLPPCSQAMVPISPSAEIVRQE